MYTVYRQESSEQLNKIVNTIGELNQKHELNEEHMLNEIELGEGIPLKYGEGMRA